MRALAAARVALVTAAVLALAKAAPVAADEAEQAQDAAAPSAARIARYPLAAFRSERPDRVERVGAWWPEWVRRPEGLRGAVVGEPGGRLRLRLAGLAGARLEGEVEVRPQRAGDRNGRARCSIRLHAGGRTTPLFERALGPFGPVPFALDLPADLGDDAALELAVDGADGSPANAAWIGSALTRLVRGARRAPEGAPSIVLVTADTLRQDEIGPYGGPTRTPSLDALAASGATFLDVHSVAFGTAPSHASMLTSSPSSRHGVRDNATPLPPGPVTLAEALSAAGYATAGFVSASVLSRALGFDRGFDEFRDVFARDPERVDTETTYHERRGEVTVARFVEWLRGREPGPFFAWIHLYDAHQPYLPPDGWADPYLPTDLPLAGLGYPRDAAGRAVYLDGALLRAHRPAEVPALAALARAGYRGEIAYLDAQVGRIRDALARSDRADAIVAFVADHGENFLEHGRALAFGHAGLHAEVTRLPLLISAPGRLPAGVRIEGLRASLDLAPTLLALAGIAPPQEWQGRDLLGPEPARDALVLEGAEREEVAVRTRAWLLCVRAPAPASPEAETDWTLPGARVSLFDLRTDPGEQRDVYREGHPALASLLAGLAPLRAAPPAAPRLDSAEHAEALRALGYAR